MRDGRLREQLEGHVVEHLAVLHDAAVAVVHVLAQADVGDHEQVRELVLDRPHGHLDDALGVVGSRGRGIFVGGDAEEEDGRDAEPDHFTHLGQQVADRELVAPRHGTDGVPDVLAGDDEQRADEVVDGERRLAHHAADRGGAAQTTHAVARVVHGSLPFGRNGRAIFHPPSARDKPPRPPWTLRHRPTGKRGRVARRHRGAPYGAPIVTT